MLTVPEIGGDKEDWSYAMQIASAPDFFSLWMELIYNCPR